MHKGIPLRTRAISQHFGIDVECKDVDALGRGDLEPEGQSSGGEGTTEKELEFLCILLRSSTNPSTAHTQEDVPKLCGKEQLEGQ